MRDYVEDSDTGAGEDPPVTAVASRRVKAGREGEFEEWAAGILAAANDFPGYFGSEVLRPGDDPGDDEYRIVFRFERASNMREWEQSEERRRWRRRAKPLIHEEKINVLTGLETWFTRPSRPGEPAPSRYKMVAVTWLAVYPLITPEFAAHAAAHVGAHGGYGHADDVRDHALHDAPVLSSWLYPDRE
jgi:antibiotic biosynthesis monooxygenase (ABM) superfamily enzyme